MARGHTVQTNRNNVLWYACFSARISHSVLIDHSQRLKRCVSAQEITRELFGFQLHDNAPFLPGKWSDHDYGYGALERNLVCLS